jgi:hypothetical protein
MYWLILVIIAVIIIALIVASRKGSVGKEMTKPDPSMSGTLSASPIESGPSHTPDAPEAQPAEAT